MTAILPLFTYPSTIAWVDDDGLFLKAITRMLSHEYLLQTFNDAHESLKFFENYKPLFTSIPFLRGCAEHENYDTIEHMPVDLNADALMCIRNHPKRIQDIMVI